MSLAPGKEVLQGCLVLVNLGLRYLNVLWRSLLMLSLCLNNNRRWIEIRLMLLHLSLILRLRLHLNLAFGSLLHLLLMLIHLYLALNPFQFIFNIVEPLIKFGENTVH